MNQIKINSFVDQANSQAEKIGAKFKGAVVHISVETGNAEIRQKQIRNAISSCPSIPFAWLPDIHNSITLYFQTIDEMKRSGLKNFIVPPGLNFNMEEHAGYTVDRIHKNIHSNYPVGHKIHRKVKFNGEITKTKENIKVSDVTHTDGIKIILERTFGNPKDDDLGTSEFDLIIESETNSQCIDEYQPFIHTLKERFLEKVNGIYNSRQIRDVILKIVKTDVKAISIQHGLYFVSANYINPIYELAEAMQKVHSGIRIQTIPVLEFPDAPILNKHVEDVKISLTENLLSEVKKFSESINEMADNEDSTTRDSTWLKRLSELRNYKTLIEDLKNSHMLTVDILEEIVKETEAIIVDKI